MSGAPYISSRDSALLRRALEGRSGGRFLDMGAGNGGALAELSGRFEEVVGTDVTRPDMRDWSKGADFVLADRGTCFRDGTFDLVSFNPPYLAGDGEGDRAVDGGRGLEVPKSFLEDSLRVVGRGGSVVFVLNDEARVEEFEAICRRQGFGLRTVASERLFFEELSVHEAVREGGGAT
jgi:methylase of polypeptide subunit release factors